LAPVIPSAAAPLIVVPINFAAGVLVAVAELPTATVIPFLAEPTRFMFFKPEPTKQAADRLAFDLDCSSTPNWRTYEQLLRTKSVPMESLRPLGAQDWLDVQW
jgi:hypothetical protein